MKKIEEDSTASADAAIMTVLAKRDKYALIVVRGEGGADGKILADAAEQYTNAWRGVVWVKGRMPAERWTRWVGTRTVRAVALGIDAKGAWHAADWLTDADDELRINEAFSHAAQVGGH
jgi:hypothetical protein